MLASACVAPAESGSGGKGPASDLALGKGDGSLEVREVGPLSLDDMSELRLDGHVPAFRVESFGGTMLEIELRGGGQADPLLVIEGPLPGNGDDTPAGTGTVLTQDDDGGDGLDARLRATLDQPGVYRVLAGTYESLGRGEPPRGARLSLATRCVASCTRPAIPVRTFLGTLREAGALDAVLGGFEAQLATLVPDEGLRERLTSQLHAIARSPDFEGIERFPAVPLRQIGAARAALGLVPGETPAPAEPIDADLGELLGRCEPGRGGPSPVDERLRGVGRGHFPDLSLTACQAHASEELARVLTALAADDGSVVRYRGEEIRTPRELFEALLSAGHAIEVRNERTYANFIGLTAGDRDVVWPVWLDTGEIVGGHPLLVPVGHSHHAWRVTGPDVDARVMFYLGISGAAFFGQTHVRPAWTGEIVTDGAISDDDADHVLGTVDVAAAYLRRIRAERATVAAGMPADGYGFVGVCNDSNAAIEYATRGSVTAFPLLRAAELDAQPALGDGLDEVLASLPNDGDVAPERRDLLRRVLLMTPHDLGSELLVDDGLRAQLDAVQAEVARSE